MKTTPLACLAALCLGSVFTSSAHAGFINQEFSFEGGGLRGAIRMFYDDTFEVVNSTTHLPMGLNLFVGPGSPDFPYPMLHQIEYQVINPDAVMDFSFTPATGEFRFNELGINPGLVLKFTGVNAGGVDEYEVFLTDPSPFVGPQASGMVMVLADTWWHPGRYENVPDSGSSAALMLGSLTGLAGLLRLSRKCQG